MTIQTYDEPRLASRLSLLDRSPKTAFANSCAQLLLPFFGLYAESVRTPALQARLTDIVTKTWKAVEGEPVDLAPLQDAAEELVPTDEDGWEVAMGYGQNAAAAAAYAIRTWLTDDPQEAARAARQVYELADYVVLQAAPGLDLNAPAAESGFYPRHSCSALCARWTSCWPQSSLPLRLGPTCARWRAITGFGGASHVPGCSLCRGATTAVQPTTTLIAGASGHDR